MSNSDWIEAPSGSYSRKMSAAEESLRDCYLYAQQTGYQLLCASNQLLRVLSPDVTACAALVRTALHKPEKERASAIKAAKAAILRRQVDYVSARTYYQQHKLAWEAIRPQLVELLKAVVIPSQETNRATAHIVNADIGLNCQAVANLIDESDIAINEAAKRRYNQPTEKHAVAGFQQVFDALRAEVTESHWVTNARLSCVASYSTEILRDLPVEEISSTEVPTGFAYCSALYAARLEFERMFSYDLTSRCRDFRQTTRGTVNDTQLSETLLAALPDVATMMKIEQRRDEQLRKYGRTWRSIRSKVETSIERFRDVAELLPAAIAEASEIEDETIRLQAQNLCLFAARRLKENLRFIRECDRFVPEREQNVQDINDAIHRSQLELVERLSSGQMNNPTTSCREESYPG